MANLKSVIDKSKELKVTTIHPLVLAAEENLHSMIVDLDKVITKVRRAENPLTIALYIFIT